MPDIFFDVDSAISEAPINIMPLLDSTDFISKEESVAYNATGLDLVWNFVTTAGAFTQTAVTPTNTGGNYDWVNQGNGFYTIEIPASGGASINNDTEGFGWFSGVADGVLPWRGPIIGFRAAAINNSLIDGATVDVNVTAMAAGVVTATVIATGAIDADAIADNAIDAGAIAADAITAAKIADGAIDAATFAAGAINAAAIANGAIDNATFAADVGSTAYATNIIALAADKAIANAALATAAELAKVPKSDSNVSWNATALAAIQSEANDAIVANRLDELLAADSDIDGAAPPAVGSVFHELLSKTAGSFTFDQTTDSLEAIRDKEADIETDTQDIQSRIPAALVSGRIDASVGAMAANTLTASALATDAVNEIVDQTWQEAIADHSGTAGSTAAALAAATAPTAAAVADAVWEEAIADHSGTAGSTAEALNAAGSAGDPWVTALPGAYGAGSAGYIVGTNLNATVSSRATQTSVDTVDDLLDSEVAAILADTNELQTDLTNGGRLDLLVDAIKAKTDLIPASPAATGDIPSAATVADAVWDEAATGHTDAGKAGQQLWTDVDAILDDTDDIGAAGAGLTALATAAELAKVPKSDGTTTWNATALGSIQSEATDALNAYDPPTKAELDSGLAALNDVSSADVQTAAAAALTAYDPPTRAELTSDISSVITQVDANETKIDAIDTVVDQILADTGTDGVVLSVAMLNKIADHVLRRTYANARASSDGDAVAFRSFMGVIAKLTNKVSISGTTLTVTHEDDSTSFGTQALTTDATADPVTAMDTA